MPDDLKPQGSSFVEDASLENLPLKVTNQSIKSISGQEHNPSLQVGSLFEQPAAVQSPIYTSLRYGKQSLSGAKLVIALSIVLFLLSLGVVRSLQKGKEPAPVTYNNQQVNIAGSDNNSITLDGKRLGFNAPAFFYSSVDILGKLTVQGQTFLSGGLNVEGATSINGTLTATNLIGNGSGLTNLNASNITTGTLNDARLSPNVALLNRNQTFTGANLFNQVIKQSGFTVCDSSNNCNFATSTSTGVTAINGQNGSVTVQGTPNQVTVATGSGTITLSTPQDLAPASIPSFGGLNINGNLSLGLANTFFGNTIQQTAAGQDININAGTDDINFTVGGRTFTLPTSGPASQVICTSGVACAGAGAPVGAAYLTVGNDATLTGERAITVNATNLSFTDGGANSSYTINTIQGIATTSSPQFTGLTLTGDLAVNGGDITSTVALTINGTGTLTLADDVSASGTLAVTGATTISSTLGVTGTSTFTGLATFNGGVTVETGDTLTFNGDAFTDLTGNGLQISTGVLTLNIQASKGLEVDLNGLSLIDCLSGEILKYNGLNQWMCAADAGAAGTGDDVLVNGTNATGANLLNTVASGTVASTTWSLATLPSPDEITLLIGTASATEAGVINTGTQTLAGDKTFSGATTLSGNLGVTGASTFTGVATFNGNLTIETGDTFTVNGDAFTDLTGTGLMIGAGALQTTLGTSVDLTSEVNGVLPIANGGTNGTATPTAGGVSYGTGTAYAFTAAGTSGQCLVSNGAGAPTFTSCAGAGSGVTLQAAYNNGQAITTTDARDIDIVLADTTTDSNFDLVVATNSTGFVSLSRADGVGTSSPAQLVLLDNLDINLAQPIAIKVQAAAGGITTALDLTDAEIVTAIALGANDITGSVFAVSGATGNVTSGTINGQTISSTASFTGSLAVGTTLGVTGATTLSSTLGVTGATTLSSTLGVTGTSTFTGAATFNGNLTIETGDTFTVNGDAFTDLTGTGLMIGAGALQTTLGTSVDLTSEVNGVLPIANGGTNGTATPTAGGVSYGTGTAYAFTAAGTSGQCLVSNGAGAPTFTSCAGAGSGVTLQAAYNNGQAITTTDARDIDIVLADTTTDSNFDLVVATNSTGFVSLSRADGVGTSSPAQLVLLDNLDINLAQPIAIKVQAAAGGITTALDLTDAEIVTAIALGANDITGSVFAVSGATGNVTSGTINGQTISSTASFTGSLAVGTTLGVTGATTLSSTLGVTGATTLSSTLGVTGTSTFTGAATFNGNLTIETGDTFTVNGDAFTDLTGTGLMIGAGALQTTLGTSVDLTSEVNGVLPIANGGTNGTATPTAGGVSYGTGTAYAFTAAGTSGQCLVSNGAGAPTFTSCAGAGSGVTLQAAYNNGQAITTTDARDIDIVLADTTTDSNFDLVVATNSTGFVSLSRADGVGTSSPAQLVLLDNLDINLAQPIAIKVQAAAGGITTALDLTDAEIVTAIALGANDITGSVFAVSGATGNVTSGTINGQTITATASFTGTLSVASTITASTLAVADNASYICRNSTNQLAACNTTGTGAAFVQGGNSFGTTAVLGTNDAFDLQFETAGTTRLTLNQTGDATLTGNLTVQGTGTSSFNGDVTIAATKTLRVIGGTTAQRPGSPTEGMIYFDTDTKQLLVYGGAAWQNMSRSSTKVVAASNSQTPAGADYQVTSAEETAGNADAKIQSAINALPAQGGTVYLMEGTYTIDTSISIPSNVMLTGAGNSTIIKLKNGINASFTAIVNSNTVAGNTHITLSNFQLDGNDANNTGTQNGIIFNKVGINSSAKGANISNLHVRDFALADVGVGIAVWNSFNTIITNNSARDVAYCINLDTTSYANVTNNLTFGCSVDALNVYNSSRNTITGNSFNNGANGIRLVAGSNNNTVSGNMLSDNTTQSIYLDDADSNIISGNKIHNGGQGNGIDGIYVANNSDSNTITSNDITDTAGTGNAINIFGATNDNNYLADNRFSGTGATTIADTGTGTIYANQSRGANGAQLTTKLAAGTDAFQIQNAAGNSLFTVDTTNSEIELGKAGASGIDGKLVVYNAANSNTVTLTVGTTSASYNLVLPTTAGASGECIKNTGTAGTLTFAACGSSGITTTLQDAYNNSSSPATITTTSAAKNLILQSGVGFNSTSALQVIRDGGTDVLTVDTTNSMTLLRGTKSDATIGSELVTSQAFNNATFWTCTGWTTTATTAQHNTGNTTACSATAANLTVTTGVTYQIQFQLAGNSLAGQTVTASIGGVSAPGIDAGGTNTHTVVIKAASSGALTFTPTTNFDGTISNISVKVITTSNPVLQIKNSNNDVTLEVRATTSFTNTLIGANSGMSNTSGLYNTALGTNALRSNTTGILNTGIGYHTLYNNTQGSDNTAIGTEALYSNTTGGANMALGYQALFSNTVGVSNVAIGKLALAANTTGSNNTAIGNQALRFNVYGIQNTAIGAEALYNNISGQFNAALGFQSLYLNTSGNNNIANGYQALYNNTTGANNVAIGEAALAGNTTGSNNTAIGRYAGFQDPSSSTFVTLNNLQNASALGHGAQVQASNSLILGGQGTNQVNVGIGTTIPINVLSVSPLQYNTGTAGTGGASNTTVTGSGTTWTSAMIGSEIIFANGNAATTPQKATITAVASTTSMTVTPAVTVANGTNYRIHYAGLQVTSAGNVGIGTTTPTADLSFGTGANRSINVVTSTTGTGNNLTLSAGSGFTNSNGGNLILQAGAKDGSGTVGSVVVKANGSESTSLFNIKTSTDNNLLTVDSINSRVGINLGGSNVPTLSSGVAGLEILGALRLTGSISSYVDLFNTPAGSNVQTKINIPVYNAGAFGQVLAFGLPSTGCTNLITDNVSCSSRAISVFDARTVAHQPSVGVFSPDESNILGFSWDGSNATSYVKSTGGNVGIRSNTTDIATFLSGGGVGIGTITPTAQLQVSATNGTNGVVGTAGAALIIASGGNGGTSSAASTAGGAGGASSLTAGNGGNASGTTSAGGAGGAITLTAGNGGNSTGVAGTNGANITLQGGAGGTGTVAGSYGNILLNTAGGNVGIGTATIGTNNRLIVNPYSTVDNLATTQINTDAATNKGLVVQGFASQSADLLQLQNSSGTSLTRFLADGSAVFGSTSTNCGSVQTKVCVSADGVSFDHVSGNVNSKFIAQGNDALVLTAGTSGNFLGFRIQGTTDVNSTTLAVRASASQTGYLFEAQNSSGTPILHVGGTGTLTITNDILQAGNGVNALGDSESMVPNAGFEVNNDTTTTVADNWLFTQTTGTPTAAVTATSPGQGDRSQQITSAATTEVGTLTSACIPVSESQSYTLTPRIKGSVAATSALTTRLVTFTTKANCVAQSSGTNVAGVTGIALTTSWTSTNYTAGVTAGAGAVWGRVAILLDTPDTAATTMNIDSVRLTPTAVNTGVDLAENFPARASDNLQPGEVVSFGAPAPEGGSYAVRSTASNDSKIFGVVSTQPGLTLDDGKGYEKVTVALAGRVPTKVSNQNGAIAAGDPITASSVPGIGMKTTTAGRIIGYAVTAYDGEGQGEIVVLISPSFWAPAISQTLQAQAANFGSLQVTGTATIANLNVSGQSTLAKLTVTGDAEVQGTLTVTKLVVTDTLTIEGHIISRGTAPQAVLGAASGNGDGVNIVTNPTLAVGGTDTAGTVTVKTGALNLASGELANITFNKVYGNPPKIVISGNNAKSSKLGAYVVRTATGFKIVSDDPLQPNTTYEFDYIIIVTTL